MRQIQSRNKVIKLFVLELFNKLNIENIQYAILRNYENIPNKPSDTDYFDLDLLVSSKDLSDYIKIVEKIGATHDLLVVKKIDREYVKTIRLAYIGSNEEVYAIQLDSHVSGQNWWGFFYLCENEILKNRSLYKTFFVVSEFHQHLFNWLDKLFWGSYVKEKYKHNILKVLSEKNEKLIFFLDRVFGKELSFQLNGRIKSGDLESTLELRSGMIKRLCRYSIFNFPLLTLISNIKFYYFELSLHIFPPGLCCVINESRRSQVDRYYKACRKVILGDQIILDYDGESVFNWLRFYFCKVFPVVRKGGLVFILSSNKARFISNVSILSDTPTTGVLKRILEANQKIGLMGAANIYLGKDLVK
jgi:hypothetical protein